MRTDVRLGTIPYEALHGVVGATRRRANRGRHELDEGHVRECLRTRSEVRICRWKKGRGKGTLSFATKLVARGNVIELENFASAPVMLTEIKAEKDD